MYFFKGILSAFAFTIIFYNENMKFKEFVKKKLFWVIVILCCISDVYYFKTLFYSNNEFDSNRTIAITTILALLYTIKIHGDNLEFQKRIALRKERLELIEEITKEFIRFENFYSSFIDKIRESEIFGPGVFDLHRYRLYTVDQILHFPIVPGRKRSNIGPKSKEDISKIMDERQSIILNDLEKNINETQLDNKEGFCIKCGFQPTNNIIKIVDSFRGRYRRIEDEYVQKLDVASLKVSDEELRKLIPVEKIFVICRDILEKIRGVIPLRRQGINTGYSFYGSPPKLLLTQLKDLLTKYYNYNEGGYILDENSKNESEAFKQQVIKKINSIFDTTDFYNIKKDFKVEINKLLEQSKLE